MMIAAPLPRKREPRRKAPLPTSVRFRNSLDMKESSPQKSDYKGQALLAHTQKAKEQGQRPCSSFASSVSECSIRVGCGRGNGVDVGAEILPIGSRTLVRT